MMDQTLQPIEGSVDNVTRLLYSGLISRGKGAIDEMSTISVELTFNQLGAAVQRLRYEQKVALWRLLGAEVDRQDSLRRHARQEFAEAVRLIRAANRGVNEDEVVADVDAAVREVRAARRATYSGFYHSHP